MSSVSSPFPYWIYNVTKKELFKVTNQDQVNEALQASIYYEFFSTEPTQDELKKYEGVMTSHD